MDKQFNNKYTNPFNDTITLVKGSNGILLFSNIFLTRSIIMAKYVPYSCLGKLGEEIKVKRFFLLLKDVSFNKEGDLVANKTIVYANTRRYKGPFLTRGYVLVKNEDMSKRSRNILLQKGVKTI